MTFKNHLMDINWEYNELRGYWHAEVNGVTLQVQDEDGPVHWSVTSNGKAHRSTSETTELAKWHASHHASSLLVARELTTDRSAAIPAQP